MFITLEAMKFGKRNEELLVKLEKNVSYWRVKMNKGFDWDGFKKAILQFIVATEAR